MEIEFSDTAKEDMKFWKESGNRAIQKKIITLLQSISQDPFRGIGKPEPLKHNYSGYWSRRINKEHRIVYTVEGETVFVISLRHHY
jgi:toxin YoeB